MKVKNNLVFCSDCKHYLGIGECSKGHNIDEITTCMCPDGIDKDSFSDIDLSKPWITKY